MKEEIISRRMETMIDELCVRFNTTIENLIPKYAHYAMCKDIGIIIASLIYIVLSAVILYFIIRKENKKDYFDRWDDFMLSFVVTILIIIDFVALAAIAIYFYDYLLWSADPSMRFLNIIINPLDFD